MLPEKQKGTKIGMGTGVLLQVIGFILSKEEATSLFGLLLLLVSMVPFISGCMN